MHFPVIASVFAFAMELVSGLTFTCNKLPCGYALRNHVCKVNFQDPRLNVCVDFQTCYKQCSENRGLTCGCSFQGEDLTLEKWKEEIADRLHPLQCYNSENEKVVNCARTKSHESLCFNHGTEDGFEVSGCVNEDEYCTELDCCCDPRNKPACNVNKEACEKQAVKVDSTVARGPGLSQSRARSAQFHHRVRRTRHEEENRRREEQQHQREQKQREHERKNREGEEHGPHHHHPSHDKGDKGAFGGVGKPYAAVAAGFFGGVLVFLLVAVLSF